MYAYSIYNTSNIHVYTYIHVLYVTCGAVPTCHDLKSVGGIDCADFVAEHCLHFVPALLREGHLKARCPRGRERVAGVYDVTHVASRVRGHRLGVITAHWLDMPAHCDGEAERGQGRDCRESGRAREGLQEEWEGEGGIAGRVGG